MNDVPPMAGVLNWMIFEGPFQPKPAVILSVERAFGTPAGIR